MHHPRQRFAVQWAWLLACVMVFGSIAPQISKVLASRASGSITWLEVCGPQGMHQVAVSTAEADTSKVPSPWWQDIHCGYCVLQQHAPALPTLEATASMTVASSERLPLGGGRTSVPKRHAREAHPPRAPPLFS